MAASWKVSRAFVRQFSSGPFTTPEKHAQAGETSKMWKKIFFFVAIPCISLGMLNSYLLTKEEEETVQRPEFIAYEHLRVRTKRYPWGDGQRTLFHNPHRNPLPSGYEADEHH